MTFFTLKLFTVLVFAILGDAEQDMYSFPLSGCDTDFFDIILMQTKSYLRGVFSEAIPRIITRAWSKLETTHGRVVISNVEYKSALPNNKCDIKLTRFDGIVTDLCSSFPSAHLNSSSLHQDIKVNIEMASLIFSEMDVGRQNSSHVAVIILDNLKYKTVTVDEIRRIPDILQEASSNMKVFIIIHDFDTEEGPIFLRDTLITGTYFDSHHVAMAMCKKCLPGWFPLDYKRTEYFMSCYILYDGYSLNWLDMSLGCASTGGNLATVESKEELHFLQGRLFFNLLQTVVLGPNDTAHESMKVHIGLKRDLESVSKRFQWILDHPFRYRPVAINHWLPGNPVGGFSHSCGWWFFKWIANYTIPDDIYNCIAGSACSPSDFSSGFSDYISKGGSEGWASVGCGTQVSRTYLCEVTLSRYVKGNDVIKVGPANNNSFNKVLRKSDFKEFEGIIVSVSAHINNEAFLNFLKDRNDDFPMFDCGDHAEAPRYISYSYVSDRIKHCSNGLDEDVHKAAELCKYTCGCLSEAAKCDNVKDCEDGSDEEDCDICSGRRCCDGTCLPSHLFNDGQIDCSNCFLRDSTTVNDESSTDDNYAHYNETCAFTCNRDQCIYPSQLNDSKVDCTGLEGPLDETIGKLEKSQSCSHTTHRSTWSPVCVYLNDRYGSILGCRDVSHLENCSDFSCEEGYYKCPDSYCIPLHYVMDGKDDCPMGEEESNIVNYSCTGNFACWNSTVCLHPDLVCDGASQCPHKDDELNCDVSCMGDLRCVAGTVTVKTNTPLIRLASIKFINIHTRYLDLSGVDLSNMTLEIGKCVELFDVKLSGCKITNFISMFHLAFCCLYFVYRLDLSYNLMTSVSEDTFTNSAGIMLRELRELNLSFNKQLHEFVNVDLISLEKLDLSDTGLLYVDKKSFHGFRELNILYLRNTRISTFYRDIFPSGFTLQTLDLRGSPVVMFFENTYNGLIIASSLHADNFGMCCPQVRGNGIPEYLCHASEDIISSCFDLISVEILRSLIWLMAGIAIAGNLIVILYRLLWNKHVLALTYGLFVLNLGISDLIMGLYLLVIAVSDVYYRDVYILYDMAWRASAVCKIAGFIATLSSETSTFFIFLITVDRFLTLKFPYGQKQFSRMTKILVISVSWIAGFMLALIPHLPDSGNSQILTPTAMCNYLLMTNERLSGWEYSLGIFIILNFIILLVTAFGQILIFRSMSENRMDKDSTNQNSLRRAQDITVAKQLSLVVLSNFMSWFPVGLVGFLSLSGHKLRNDVYAWTVVFVFPINSAINPVLYTVPLLMNKLKKFKRDLNKHH